MSLDFTALFDVSNEAVNPEWLLERVETNPTELADVIERYKDMWLPKTWMIETSVTTEQREVLGPGGFSIRFLSGIAELYHMMPFRTFTGDSVRRHLLRRACLFLADCLGSGSVIYTHELMPHDGENLEQVAAGLRAQMGPPAATFEELHAADEWGPCSWYIEAFSDLRGE